MKRPLPLDTYACRLPEFEAWGSRKAAEDLVLSLGELGGIGVEPIRPQMRAVLCIGQLHIDPNRFAGSPEASFDNIGDAELTTDPLYVDRFALEGKGRVAGDHEAAGYLREIGGRIVGHSIGEKFQLRIV